MLAAQRAFETGDWETCVSRAYYAAYHAVIHLLETRGGMRARRRWDHTQVSMEFLTLFARRGFLFERRDFVNFGRLYEDRLKADYDLASDRRSAIRSLQVARSLIARVSEVTHEGSI